MEPDLIITALTYGRKSAYDLVNKTRWLKIGQSVMRQLAKDLALPEGSFDIRTCKGGSAVAGEAILHHDRLYVCLSASSRHDAGYARRCKGRTDYTGEQNHPIPMTYNGLLNLCRGLMQEATFEVYASP